MDEVDKMLNAMDRVLDGEPPVERSVAIPSTGELAERSEVGFTLENVEHLQRVFGSWIVGDPGDGVTIEKALTCPPVWCAATFLSRTMANIPAHVFKPPSKNGKTAAVRQYNAFDTILNKSPNGEVTAFDFKEWIFFQMWTEGAGRAWIERDVKGKPKALWHLENGRTQVARKGFKKVYIYHDTNGRKTYPAKDVFDLTHSYKADFLTPRSPIRQCRGAIGLYLNHMNYANSFFKGGGVPPLTLEGPMASGPEAQKRATKDVELSIKTANEGSSKVLPIPVGYKLNQLAFDPSKGQMVEAKKASIIEIAQAFQLGPAFLQDLSNGKFDNMEQQDLSFVKHLVSHYAKKFEQEANLKLFGLTARALYCEHNLATIQRGDFKTRIEALARQIQTAQITPNEARQVERKPRIDNPAADELQIQGATVPLGKNIGTAPPPKNEDTE